MMIIKLNHNLTGNGDGGDKYTTKKLTRDIQISPMIGIGWDIVANV